MTVHRKTFHFSIQRAATAWRWKTLDSDGVTLASGLAPSRKLAAACVIRALARQEADPQVTGRRAVRPTPPFAEAGAAA